MKYDLQKVHNMVTVLPYFSVMIRPYPEEIDISHFSLSFTTHTSRRLRLSAGASYFL